MTVLAVMSVTDVTIAQDVSGCHHYDLGMTRWEPNPRGRLARAAMELYRERGFDRTTVAQIAGRAGLTERTFFRHFADKREILFAGGSELQELVVAAIACAPRPATPLEAAVAGIEAAATALEERRGRDFARQRQAIIAASPELRERELHKLAAMAAGVCGALRERGAGDTAASILGEVTIALFRVSFERWVKQRGGPGLNELIRRSLAELRALTTGPDARAGVQ
jgi:AcrR family transcriptional regulator